MSIFRGEISKASNQLHAELLRLQFSNHAVIWQFFSFQTLVQDLCDDHL